MLNSSLMTEELQEDVARKRLQSIIINVLGQKKVSERQWDTKIGLPKACLMKQRSIVIHIKKSSC